MAEYFLTALETKLRTRLRRGLLFTDVQDVKFRSRICRESPLAPKIHLSVGLTADFGDGALRFHIGARSPHLVFLGRFSLRYLWSVPHSRLRRTPRRDFQAARRRFEKTFTRPGQLPLMLQSQQPLQHSVHHPRHHPKVSTVFATGSGVIHAQLAAHKPAGSVRISATQTAPA